MRRYVCAFQVSSPSLQGQLLFCDFLASFKYGIIDVSVSDGRHGDLVTDLSFDVIEQPNEQMAEALLEI